MDELFLGLVPAEETKAGQVEVRGPPYTEIVVQFSPNLTEWYPWSTNTIPGPGVLRVSLEPPIYWDPWEAITIPPAPQRFFRAVAR